MCDQSRVGSSKIRSARQLKGQTKCKGEKEIPRHLQLSGSSAQPKMPVVHGSSAGAWWPSGSTCPHWMHFIRSSYIVTPPKIRSNKQSQQQQLEEKEDRARNGETDLRDGDGQVELARADVLHAGAGGGSVLVLGQLHVPRRVAAARLRHCCPLLASPPRVFGLPTKWRRATRWGVGTGASGGVRSGSRRVRRSTVKSGQ